MLFGSQLLQEFLLLLRIKAFQSLYELHSLVLELGLFLHSGRALLDSRVHDVLTLTLFLLRRNLIYDLLMLLRLLLG